MSVVSTDSGWQSYAASGRPDFLNYLQRGDVTWAQLWEFYRESSVAPETMLRLVGLFHIFHSHEYDAEGCVLDHDGRVYARLRAWATFAVGSSSRLPESRLRENLAGLLEQSLVSPLYYEAAFSVYLEAMLERHASLWSVDGLRLEGAPLAEPTPPEARRLSLHLPAYPEAPDERESTRWNETMSALVDRHYAAWNEAYAVALGEDEADWIDVGGSG